MKVFCLALLLSTQLVAALPPFAEAKREIQAILESDKLSEFVPYGDVFEEIVKIDGGYLIVTNKRAVQVIVHFEKNPLIGPPKINLEFVPSSR